jgi:hypothetical protein
VGCWGVKSYEIDEATDALDAGFDRAHGALYEELMDDRNPLTFEQVQEKLANERTLDGALEQLVEEFGDDFSTWDEEARLAYVGVTVRHAELKVPVRDAVRQRAIEWLEDETIEWEEPTKRKLRIAKEIRLLSGS